jgi:thioredoxin 1
MSQPKTGGTFRDLIEGNTPVLIDFYTDWCAPCRMMPPILEELKNMTGEELRIVKINTETNQQLSASLGIRSIPTLVMFKDGKEVWRQSGVVPAAALFGALSPHLS